MRRFSLVAAVLALAAAGPAQAALSPAQVVREWSRALNANDNEAAARLFAPNARVVQAAFDVRLTSHALAVAFNASLPCAGRIVEIRVHRDHAIAIFVLGHRPKHACDGPGVKAAALFVVQRGQIVLWEQVAVPPPDKPTA